MKKLSYLALFASMLLISSLAFSLEPIQLENTFNIDEVKWVQTKGTSSVHGQAFLTLKNKESKGCAGFGVELLPVAKYANERILKTYGNNDHGQVLMEDNPPKFTPDAKEYHDLVFKTKCNSNNEFSFKNISAGEYYVIAFIIWDINENGKTVKAGGAAMKKIKVAPNENIEVLLN